MKCDVVVFILIAAMTATAQSHLDVPERRTWISLPGTQSLLDVHSTKTPVAGIVSSPFGLRKHPILGFLEFHKGTDIAATVGSPVHVIAAGIVEEAGLKGTYGLYVRIRHALDFQTAYAHLSALTDGIRPGVMVFASDVLGRVGSTGRAQARTCTSRPSCGASRSMPCAAPHNLLYHTQTPFNQRKQKTRSAFARRANHVRGNNHETR
jgi:hypothetical protein